MGFVVYQDVQNLQKVLDQLLGEHSTMLTHHQSDTQLAALDVFKDIINQRFPTDSGLVPLNINQICNAIYMAVRYLNIEVTEKLLSLGANSNSGSEHHLTPLAFILQPEIFHHPFTAYSKLEYGDHQLKIAELLLSAGANIDKQIYLLSRNAENNQEISDLILEYPVSQYLTVKHLNLPDDVKGTILKYLGINDFMSKEDPKLDNMIGQDITARLVNGLYKANVAIKSVATVFDIIEAVNKPTLENSIKVATDILQLTSLYTGQIGMMSLFSIAGAAYQAYQGDYTESVSTIGFAFIFSATYAVLPQLAIPVSVGFTGYTAYSTFYKGYSIYNEFASQTDDLHSNNNEESYEGIGYGIIEF
jgi:hypothetical protein